MKKFIILGLLTIFYLTATAQEPNDCANAISVCGNGTFMSNAQGAGAIQEISSCGGFEHNSLWLRIDIVQSGTLGFDLIPNDPDINVDYDFWVYGPNRACSSLGTPIRCATTNPVQAGLPDNHTGINGSTTLTQTGPGANGNGYVYWLTVTAGQYYYIAIDRPSGDGGFELQWTGTAMSGTGAFPDPPTANQINDIVQCSSTPDIAVFDLNSVRSSINPDLVNNTVVFYGSLADATDGINPLPNFMANSTNPQEIFAKVTNGLTDCYSLVSFNLIVSTLPTASLSVSANAICEGENVTFSLTGTPEALVHYTTNGVDILDITLDSMGDATVILSPSSDITFELLDAQVIDGSNTVVCSEVLNESQTITVTPNADASFTLNANCTGATATINGTTGGTFAFDPDLGDGALINSSTGTITNGISGTTYTVTYTISGMCGDSSTENVTILPAENASFNLNASCTGATTTINGTIGGTFAFDPDLGDGAAIDSNTGTISNGVPGTTYTVRYTTPGTCADTSTQTVMILLNDDASFSLTATCTGATATINGTTGGTFSFDPNPNDEAAIDSNTGTISNGVPGATYTVRYTTSGSCSNTNTEMVTVLPSDDASFSLTPNCNGATATINGTVGGTFTFNPPPSDSATINTSTGEILNATAGASYSVEYTTPGICPDNHIESITIYSEPSITNPTPLVVCDDVVQDGFTSINLDDKNDEITGGNANYQVSYHLTQAFADAGTPQLSIPYTNLSNPQIVFVRVEDSSTGCYTTTTLELQVGTSLSVNLPSDQTFCDPDNDGFGVFDLDSVTTEITGGDPTYIVTYHETETNAELNISPQNSPYNNISSYNQTLWVRVENSNINSDCPTILELQLIVYNTPEIIDPEPLHACDDNSDGFAVFDITTRNNEILNGLDPTQYTITFFESETDAETPTGAISSPSNYTNSTASNQTIWIRVEDTNTNCYSITSLELVVNPLPTAIEPTPLELCDDAVADEYTVFDLTVKNDEITNGNAASVSISYFETLTDAESETNAIDPDTAYTNTSINGNSHNPQTLHVRVEDMDTGCYALTTLTIRVLPNPTPTSSDNLNTLEDCDNTNPGDLTEMFDLTSQETLILNGEPGVTPTYHETLADAESGSNAITNPASYNNISSPQTIYVRVTNDITGCYTIVDFDIIVHPVPMPQLEESYMICVDSNGTEVVGTPIIDTGLSNNLYTFSWNFNGTPIAGATDSFYEPTEVGQYSVNITDNNTLCSFEAITGVEMSSPPTVTAEVTTDAFSDNATIVASATGTAGTISTFEYSLDNGPWQTSGTFSNVTYGSHIVRARDINGCGEDSIEVSVIDYPAYFTPNGDGYHDTWNIYGLANLGNAKIYIFDRYGKMLKQLSPSGIGWDGNYDGAPLPSSDYWFVVTYEELGISREFRSHFTLKR